MAWYNSSWTKRKPITLTGGASGAQTAYQVKLTVAYDSDMQADFDDLRFTKADGTTLVDAWLESKTDSTSAIVWVETDTPANTVEADIYMYYGNSTAANSWNIKNTMLFGDDFPGTTLDAQWNDTSGTIGVSGGELTLNSTDKIRASGYSKLYDCRCRFRNKKSNTSSGLPRLGMSNTAVSGSISADDCMCIYPYNSGELRGLVSNEGTPSYGTIGSYVANTYYNYELTWKSGEVKIYQDDTLKGTYTSNTPNEALNPRIGIQASGCDLTFDWYFISKWVENPATYAFGSEESEGAWAHKVMNITSPARVINVVNASIAKVMGV